MEKSGCDQERAIQQSNTIASAVAQSSSSGRIVSEVETGGDVAIREFNVVDQQDPEREMMGSQETVAPPSALLIRFLYIGYLLARWGARMWEFTVALYFISLWPSSLLFAAIYGIVESASTAIFGALVGKWLDKSTYTKVLRVWLLTQNFSFLIAGGTVMELLCHPNLKSTNFVAFISLVILICFCGAIGVLSALAGSILIEREWVVVISEGHPTETLTRMNSVIRRIDLICKLFAPVASGFFVSFASLKASAMAFVLWNFVSVWLQYWLMSRVYSGIPTLRESNRRRRQQITSGGTEDGVSTLGGGTLHDEASGQGTEEKSLMRRKMNLVMSSAFMVSWRTYLKQEFWDFDDGRPEMGRNTCLYYWYRPWNECHYRNRGNSFVPFLAFSHFDTSYWTLVYLVPVDLPNCVRCIYLGSKQAFISVHVDGGCGNITIRIVDV